MNVSNLFNEQSNILQEKKNNNKLNESFDIFVKEEVKFQDEFIIKKEEASFFNSIASPVRKKRICKVRGNYNICTLSRKKEAIRISRIKSIKEASRMLNIPEKNIKRWIRNGPDRKKGAGRKMRDPIMEKNILQWILEHSESNHKIPNSHEIKQQAKKFSNLKDFKASKGWCDKFLRRNFRFLNSLEKSQI